MRVVIWLGVALVFGCSDDPKYWFDTPASATLGATARDVEAPPTPSDGELGTA